MIIRMQNITCCGYYCCYRTFQIKLIHTTECIQLDNNKPKKLSDFVDEFKRKGKQCVYVCVCQVFTYVHRLRLPMSVTK